MPRADGSFEVLEHLNDDAYKVGLPEDHGVSDTFNVDDLRPYLDDDYLTYLRANSSQQGENDGGPSILPSRGPKGSQGGSKFSRQKSRLLERGI